MRRNTYASITDPGVVSDALQARGGLGTQFYKWGSVYTGEWAGDLRHGYGIYVSVGGDAYIGEYSSHEKHGWGAEVTVEEDGLAVRFGRYAKGRPSGPHVLLRNYDQDTRGNLFCHNPGRANRRIIERFLLCSEGNLAGTQTSSQLERADGVLFATLTGAGQIPLPAQVGSRTLEASLGV